MNGSRLADTVVFQVMPDGSTPSPFATILPISTSNPVYSLPVCRPRPGWSALTPMTSFFWLDALPMTPLDELELEPDPEPASSPPQAAAASTIARAPTVAANLVMRMSTLLHGFSANSNESAPGLQESQDMCRMTEPRRSPPWTVNGSGSWKGSPWRGRCAGGRRTRPGRPPRPAGRRP